MATSVTDKERLKRSFAVPAGEVPPGPAKQTRVERMLFAAFLFLLPFQARVFLGEFGGEVFGNEWTQAWLWASDIALLGLFGFWFRRGVSRKDLYPLLFLLFFLPSLAVNPSALGLWVLVKTAEGLLLFSYARTHRGWLLTTVLWPAAFLVGLVLNAVVAVAQFAVQHDLQLQFLGESPLDPAAPGVAKFSVNGAGVLRGYGFTPHPNILAALLLAGVTLTVFFYIFRGLPHRLVFSPRRLREELVRGLLFFIFLFGLIVAFSRIAWFAAAVFLVAVLLTAAIRHSLREVYFWEALRFTILAVAVIAMALVVFWPFVQTRVVLSPDEQAVALRQFYGQQAAEMIREHPITGVGLGRFVPALVERNPQIPRWQAQPVHNVVLLLAAENGIPATFALLAGFVFLFLATWRRVINIRDPGVQLVSVCLIAFTTGILLFSTTDHFLWTTQQGWLLLWFTLGLLAA